LNSLFNFNMNQSQITADAIGQAVNDVIALPLLVPHDRDYANMIERVVQNRIARQLRVEMDIGLPSRGS